MQKEALGEKHADALTTKHWVARCLYEKKNNSITLKRCLEM